MGASITMTKNDDENQRDEENLASEKIPLA